MTITMKDTRLPSILELHELLTGSEGLSFSSVDRAEAYVWIEETLRTYDYLHRSRKDKGLIRRYIAKMTGYSRAQIARFIREYRKTTHVAVRTVYRHRFPTRYTREDVVLLAGVDDAHNTLSGPATKRILVREYTVFRDENFIRLSRISVSHLYNLRKTYAYRKHVLIVRKTRPASIPIGLRVKPTPEGRPGFLRVDTVHQGDSRDGAKGVYHINLVDEVVQWEILVAVSRISEAAMVTALMAVLDAFPFAILNFHADNGGEYINYVVAKLLETLRIKLTKSRPRHSQDNGLVETKNGAVVRKALGYAHISSVYADRMNRWYDEWFTPYLNFHRPCAFPTETTDEKGRIVRVYRTEDYQTPYEKLKGLPGALQYLKPGITFDSLDWIAYATSDTTFARQMQEAKQRLFSEIAKRERSQQKHPSPGSSLD